VITRPDGLRQSNGRPRGERLQAPGFQIMMGPDMRSNAVTTKLISGTANAAYFASLRNNVTPSPTTTRSSSTRALCDFVAAPMSAPQQHAITMTFALTWWRWCMSLLVVGRHPPGAHDAAGDADAAGDLFLRDRVGFMLIEISQMQRLMVFLGHPVLRPQCRAVHDPAVWRIGSTTVGARSPDGTRSLPNCRTVAD